MSFTEYKNFSPLHWIVIAIVCTMLLGVAYWIAKTLLLPAIVVLTLWTVYRWYLRTKT